ncbi:TOMM precursor leader peptide-binding protein [Actinacidiphila guanduensis]|uniref:Ribosomal protein S12 methylthiotransferase accessory factor n=1 Tax=Actinacidiphila guanduensis TaxID=310781 RepID=A0A1H0MD46_9ACTN|nr:TOMM precursor leader peptide-binding protein [Actinacidiphila guanduensis]SDO78343.1 ribosomal protein S12 methylthiotransferase accessory factor [Actinacidiphila guanduensis]
MNDATDDAVPARKVLRFRPHLTVGMVPADAAYLFAEGETYAIPGAVTQSLVPYLAGKHTQDEIVTALADTHPPEIVYHTLGKLRARGYVVEWDDCVDPVAAALWEGGGFVGDRALAAATALTCEVVAVGDVDTEPVRRALTEAGITCLPAAPTAVSAGTAEDTGTAEAARTGDEGSTGRPAAPPAPSPGTLRVVLADDYLHPALAEIDRTARATGRPWLLARPVGTSTWIGPLFEPGTTGCWHCLAFRLRRNRMVETYVEERTGQRLVPVPAAVPSTSRLAAQSIALRVQRWAAGVAGAGATGDSGEQLDAGHGHVEVLHPLAASTVKHPPVHRAQCPECGEADLQARLGRRPITLAAELPVVFTEGGYRTKEPEALMAELEQLISPITGVIAGIETPRIADTRLPDGVVHTCIAGHNFALGAVGLDALREGLRSRASGKGSTALQARVGAVCEAVERYSGLFHGDEARITATYRELGEQAIHPNSLAQFSERQYRERDRWNAGDSSFAYVGVPFDENMPLEWSPIHSLTGGPTRYMPTMQHYYFYPKPHDKIYAWADSNGCAAGTTPDDALLQGMMELFERDAVAMWWYNRVPRPAVDLDTSDDPFVARCRDAYRSVRRELWVLDVTNDLGVPVFVAASRRTDKPVEDILMAFGAHLDPRVALRRALSELNQFLPAVVDVATDGSGYRFPDPTQLRWWATARLADHPYLAPDAARSAVSLDSFGHRPSHDIARDLRHAIDVCTTAGLETYALDFTRPDIGLPVMKAIVPGLRHFWARFAPGRLYDVPVALGWLDAPTAEADLNPVAMFL